MRMRIILPIISQQKYYFYIYLTFLIIVVVVLGGIKYLKKSYWNIREWW